VRRSPRRITAAVAAFTLAAAGVVALAPAASAASGDLLFSEYVEGSSNNKALEIYNPTTAPVDLAAAGYSVQLYSNGSATAGTPIALTGTIAPDDVFVLASSSAVIPGIVTVADQTTGASLYNGDDAVALVKGGAIVDVIGQIGVRPVPEWGSGLTSTGDNTLRRAADICVGDADGANAFDPVVGWSGFAQDTADGLGAHDADCALDPATDPDPDPDPVAGCDLDVVTIGSVQGSGATSPLAGQTVRVEGVVVGDFQGEGSLSGYFLQSLTPDDDPLTSEGVFVYAPGDAPVEVSVGDIVNVAGAVSEYASPNGTLTEITVGDADVCATGTGLPEPATLSLPATPEQREALEGMYVTLPQPLTILEHFEFGRYGTVEVGTTRQVTPTAIVEPGEEAIALAQQQASARITVDDASSLQNPDPLLHPNGDSFSLANDLRAGDQLANVTGILDYHFGTWAVQPTEAADYTPANPRPDVPDVGGDLTVASFNVLNYFTTIGSRGAESDFEFERQEAKIVSAIAAIDADVVGLIEIENSATDAAVATLVNALNETVGAGTYAYIPTGRLGTDVITNALIYQPASVRPLGVEKVLDGTVDPTFLSNNRPALAQTFAPIGAGEPVTVVVNHLKSKGSACAGDPDTGDGSGNCNLTRTAAAEARVKWLATDPTGQDTVGRELIMGDLNSYDKEDPIDALIAGGYTDLLLRDQGEEAYSYVFDGLVGYLDYALAGPGLAPDVTGADVWSINADEAPILDYNVNFKSASQVEQWFAPDAFRSSDHDPVIVGIDLDTVPPTISATADPAVLFPPNGKQRTVTIDVKAADDSGEVTIELVDAVAAGNKKARIEEISDTSFSVTAAVGAFYTFTYRATDAAGNSATTTTVVRVGR
jgi:predicted extracellular nuclease